FVWHITPSISKITQGCIIGGLSIFYSTQDTIICAYQLMRILDLNKLIVCRKCWLKPIKITSASKKYPDNVKISISLSKIVCLFTDIKTVFRASVSESSTEYPLEAKLCETAAIL